MKTIGNIIHKNNFPINIYNDKGNLLYYEELNGYWRKLLYDDQGNQIYFENIHGYIIYDKRL